jgi:hypothetical protein
MPIARARAALVASHGGPHGSSVFVEPIEEEIVIVVHLEIGG